MDLTDSAPVPPESVPAAGGLLWYDSRTRTLTLWLDPVRTDTVVASQDTPEAVDAALARRGWPRESGFAFAADSDTVRYAAIGPITDPDSTGPACPTSATSLPTASR
ncbi:hypothetical protein [Nocardia miyunensis]|uniref:hypothetical protein n=1 Tax=Nocardia miyunensis TaxID=282684 RepID=UPI00083368D6|nr:hypothetical protein [Nocardia miyunensis]